MPTGYVTTSLKLVEVVLRCAIIGGMHVQYSLSETTRIHDLSTRKMHLIRGNRRTAVLTNRTICTIRESL